MVLPVFTVSRAEVVDGTHVRVYFSCPIESNVNNLNTANFSFGGSHSLYPLGTEGGADYIDVNVNEMQAGTSYTVTVVNVRDVFSRVIRSQNSASFTGAGDSPELASVTALDSHTVRVVFSEQMTNSPRLRNVENYIFTGDYELRALSINVVSSKIVDITTTAMIPASAYFISITNVFDLLNNIITPKLGKRNFASPNRPIIESTICYTSPYRVRISFSREMLNNAALVDPTNYVFTGPSTFTGTRVVWIDWHTVEVYYANAHSQGEYRVTVYNATDTDGLVPDPYSVGAIFTTFGAGPSLTAITYVTPVTLYVDFDSAMLSNAALITASNYTFSGAPAITTSSVSVLTSRRVQLTVSVLPNTTNYTLRVRNAVDVHGNSLVVSTKAFTTGSYAAAQISSATALNYYTVRVVFSRAMLNNAALTSASNYVITGATTVTTSTVTRINSTMVDLVISGEARTGFSYTLTVSNVVDTNNVPMTTNTGTFVGIGIAPRLSSATAQDYNTIRLVFNKDMLNNAALTNAANYTFVGASTLTTATVTRINAVTVDVDTNEMLQAGSYTVTVTTVQDIDGNTINASYDHATFSGIGVRPQVSSASFIDSTHIDVVFNESMKNDAVLTTTTNYAVTGTATPIVSLVVRQNATTVRLTIPFTLSGAYTVTVSNVTDLAGNVIDPAHDDANFNVVLTRPEVTSVTNSTETALLMNFSENMSDTGLTTNGNYSVAGAAEYPFSNHPTLSEGICCYFEFNSNVTDSTGNVVATPINAPTYVAGKWGTAINFDGSNQGVLLGNPVILRVEYITIATWVYIDAADTNSSICSKRGPTSHDWYWADNHFTVSIGGTNNDVHPLVDPRGAWKLLCRTFDGASEQLWVNGSPLIVLDSSEWKRDVLVGAPMANLTSNTSIGYMTDAGYYLKAKMEMFAIWNRRLTNQEISDLYNSGSGLPY